MRLSLGVILLPLLITLTFAQEKPKPAPEFKKSLKNEMTKLKQQEALLNLKEKKLDLARRERILNSQKEAFDRGLPESRGNLQRCQLPPWQRTRFRSFLFIKFFILLAMFILHILLTFLVFDDMRKRNSFYGLWMPIILLGGPFTSITYAIFRNADMKKVL